VAGLGLDLYLVSRIILGEPALAAFVTAGVLTAFGVLWLLVPRHERSVQEGA
jgi:hypothetical protein